VSRRIARTFAAVGVALVESEAAPPEAPSGRIIIEITDWEWHMFVGMPPGPAQKMKPEKFFAWPAMSITESATPSPFTSSDRRVTFSALSYSSTASPAW
jgi:hypothetical protein